MLKATQLMALASASVVSANTEPSYQAPELTQEQYNAVEALEEHFMNPRPVYNPDLVRKTLARYLGCKKACNADDSYHNTNIQQSIDQLGAYTSCVTKCAAKQMFHTSSEGKDTMTKLYNIGFDKLVKSREYLSGNGDFQAISKDPIRLEDSCCVSDDYFAPFEKIMVDVNAATYQNVPKGVEEQFNARGDNSDDYAIGDFLTSLDSSSDAVGEGRIVSMDALVSHCALLPEDRDAFMTNVLAAEFCDHYDVFMRYLNLLKVHVGHLILKTKPPSCHKPDEENANQYNPEASPVTDKLCVAKSYHFVDSDGFPTSTSQAIDCPWAKRKPVDGVCYSDFIPQDSGYMFVEYDMDLNHDFHVITGGLPSGVDTDNACVYDLNFSAEYNTLYESDHKYSGQQVVSQDNVNALAACMNNDFEYCNVAQYAEFLHSQLYVEDCDGNDALACLYKVETLKCDCMDAVLACYSSGGHFTTELTETIGSAASILCGFLLCQEEGVYSLFGGDVAFERANVMRELLANIGLANASSSLPAATFAFLAFGLGMVAFFTTKFITSSKKLSVSDGYRNLI
jgi:hypothetical protein